MANVTLARKGFGQVEPNHLSAQRTGQIYAQLPAATTINMLENGQFVKYDYANNAVNFSGAGEWMMVFNEVKLYDDWRETYKDFAMTADNYAKDINASGTLVNSMTPRVIKTNIGDIYTTNCYGGAGTKNGTCATSVTFDAADITTGVYMTPGATGYLAVAGSKPASGMVWQVVAVTTMPDGDKALKLMRIQ